ncbi:aldose 1-epimerase [Histidinibacterium lentulum]|uniref:Aldose 1-epimerase n=1 Tax=Histidinibacterium lentulum TaxID=2480588 RepID=A0A3N2R6A6_9RHOB|nr:aldose 1-epimerase [Histidinibacterium lentulum]ROU02911.1 aldose 1-epimerase [Histidinibacterium lentulum]
MTGRVLTLSAGPARLEIVPDMGGGIAGLWADGVPVLRTWSGVPDDGPFALACNLLAPFSNRISGGFCWEGQRNALSPNLPGEPCPIHGDAFQRPWEVREASGTHAVLALEQGAFGPWRYRATLHCLLLAERVDLDLTVTNRGDTALPFGLGFHPWFPRMADTALRFAASGVWEEGAGHLPAGTAAVPLPPDWDFHEMRALPQGWINNAFADFGGTLTIARGAATPVTLSAGEPLSTLVVYSPSAEAEFFCAEPVSHPVDAVNLPGLPGLRTLAPGEAMTGRMTLGWR